MLDYQKHNNVALLKLDDGKANAVGHNFIEALNKGLDQALNEAEAVLICGRTDVFSAGFDLKELQKGATASAALVNKGAAMLLRLFSHPQPVVVACTGHAVAAGALVLLAADSRIGIAGEYQIGLNETAIGMSLPNFAIQLANARLSKRHNTRAVIQAQLFNPAAALDVGFLDEVVSPENLLDSAMAEAAKLAVLPTASYAANKLAIRQAYINSIRDSLQVQ